MAKYNNQDSSLQFITDSAVKCSVYFRPHITLVSKVSQQLNIWTYLSVKSRIASSYACTSSLCRVACDVSGYGISIPSLRRLLPQPFSLASGYCLRSGLTDFKLTLWIVSSLFKCFLEISCMQPECKNSFIGLKKHLKQHLVLNAPTTLLGQESMEIQWVVTHMPWAPILSAVSILLLSWCKQWICAGLPNENLVLQCFCLPRFNINFVSFLPLFLDLLLWLKPRKQLPISNFQGGQLLFYLVWSTEAQEI